jgi:hypothetical protein
MPGIITPSLPRAEAILVEFVLSAEEAINLQDRPWGNGQFENCTLLVSASSNSLVNRRPSGIIHHITINDVPGPFRDCFECQITHGPSVAMGCEWKLVIFSGWKGVCKPSRIDQAILRRWIS